MSRIGDKALRHRQSLRTALASRYPALLPVRPLGGPPVIDRSAIALGCDGRGERLMLPQRPRLEHALVIGTTGGGKTNLLEHCIRQDIANGCGVCVVDPHGEHPGSLYRTLLAWMDRAGYTDRRTVHLIDPNAESHTVGFNPLARFDAQTDISVIVGATLEAFSRAWGGEDTSLKPTIERVITTAFGALAELGLSLAEAGPLLDRQDRHGLRAFALANVKDRYTREELQRLHELSLDERRRHDFDLEVVGPINRLARFVRPPAIRAMVGQTERALDLREAMDEGHIILCNLSGGARVYERDADLLGRLLTRSLFFHAKRRRQAQRPFFVYLDECHRYLSGDLENILAEIRKYGVGTILSHQWQQQLGAESENMLAAVRNATNLKVVFRIKDPKEAEELAQAVIPLDLEMPVQKLVRPTVTGYRRAMFGNESRSQQLAFTDSVSETHGTSASETVSYAESISKSNSENWSTAQSESASINEARSQSLTSAMSNGTSQSDMLLPAQDLLGAPLLIASTRGGSAAEVSSAGHMTGSGRSEGTNSSRSAGGSRSVSHSSTWGESYSRGTYSATSIGQSTSRGTAQSTGHSEALEPILTDLPTSVHSKESVLYMASQTLRSLPTGRAVMNYVGEAGMVSALLHVPRISEIVLSPVAFAALRKRIFSGPAALPIEDACAALERRERNLMALASKAEEPEPESFRTKAPLTAAKRERTPSDAASRRRPSSDSKRKLSGR